MNKPNKLVNSEFDAVVDLKYNRLFFSNKICWERYKVWLDERNISYIPITSPSSYLDIPHTLVMYSQDAIIFKLVFGL
jgi:hypothetical protein